MNMSVDEIRKIIEELDEKYESHETDYGDISFYNFLCEDFSPEDLNDDTDPFKEYFKEFQEKLGKVSLIESERDSGSGDYDGYHWVFKIDDRLFQLDGYYNSWDGYDCYDRYSFYEVEEATKVVKYYKAKQKSSI